MCREASLARARGLPAPRPGEGRADPRHGFWRAALVAFTLAWALGCAAGKRPPSAERGELDLAGWRFVQDGSVPLTGEWALHWNKLLDPAALMRAEAPRPDRWMTLPGYWTDLIVGGRRLPSKGVATLRLRLKLPPAGKPLGLWIQEQTTSYRLWFDGRVVAQSGEPWQKAHQPGVHPQRLVIEPGRSSVDVVLQVANSAARLGGPTHPVLLGDYKTLSQERRRLRDLDGLLFGSLMVMGLYHAGVFLLRRRERPALHIALVCLIFGARIPFFGLSGRPIADFLPGLSWELYSRVEASTVLWGVAAIMLYVGSVLSDRSVRIVVRFAVVAAALLTVLLLVLPRHVSELATLPWFAVSALVCGYVLFISARAALRGEEVGWYLVAGWILVASAGLLEIVMDLLSPAGTHLPLVPFGVFAFLLLQAWLIARRLYTAFTAVEALSTKLQQTNTHLLRLEKLKDEFLANTSHELRTPVHGIIGLSETLLQGAAGALSTRAQETLQLIVSSGQRLSALISDLLDLTRLRRDDIRLTLGPVDLRALSSAAVGLLEPVARAKGLALSSRIGGLPAVRGDENRLHQVLVNLVGNAIKYTQQGEVSLSAAVVEDRLQLVVADTGVGIPTDQLELVFERDRRLERSELDGIPGAGLGLTIARKLIELHGGTIRAENAAKGGSRFCVELPLWSSRPSLGSRPGNERSTTRTGAPDGADASRHELAAGEPHCTERREERLISISADMTRAEPERCGPALGDTVPLPLASHDWGDARVLVVDDDPINLRLVESHLRMSGADVHAEHSGIKAVNLLAGRANRFDLMFVDVMMPGLTGYEVTRKVRERYEATELPVILLTARGQTSDVIQGFEAGANDYLVKPFSSAELLARGLLHLGLKRAFEALRDQTALERELDRQRRREELARLSAERERLEKLRYQLNPHFLFNALASIRGAIAADTETARDMIGILGEYCRLTLAHGHRDLLPLGEELAIAQLYLRMDQARRRDPIDVQWQIDPGLDAVKIPTFLLQPLVENAVKYGRRTCTTGRLRVRLQITRLPSGGLLVRISNTGTWVEPGLERGESLGVGLENVRRRLRHQFGEQGTLSTEHGDGWVHVSVALPAGEAERQAPLVYRDIGAAGHHHV